MSAFQVGDGPGVALARTTTPHHVGGLAEKREDLVDDAGGVAVRGKVVLSLQGRRLARRAHEVHRPVLGDEVGPGPVPVEARFARTNVDDDELDVLLGLPARSRGRIAGCLVRLHYEQ